MAGKEKPKRKSRRGAVLLAAKQTNDDNSTDKPTDGLESNNDTPPSALSSPKPSIPSLPPSFQLRRATTADDSIEIPTGNKRKVSQSFKVGALSAHRNSFSGTPRNLRRDSTKKGLNFLSSEAQQRRYSVVRIKSNGSFGENVGKLTPASEALTQQQISAFKEAFDLFDKNGGGTIDALELKKTLESVGIFLEEEEIHDVMMRLDKDGNGEIDFEEFLNMMTNTEMFLEAFASRHGGDKKDLRRERDVLLFDALTEFMKKSALKDAHEIVGYYAKTYRKVVKSYNKNKGAHVVGHYADGARLIGLTEKQLVMQLKQLTLSQNYGNEGEKASPYAQPLHLSMLRSVTNHGRKFGKKRKRKKHRSSKRPASEDSCKSDSVSVSTDDTMFSHDNMRRNQSVIATSPTFTNPALKKNASEHGPKSSGKIILKFVINRDALRKDSTVKRDEHVQKETKKNEKSHRDDKDIVIDHKPGWLSQRNIMYNVDISLPTKYRHVQVDRLPRLRKTVEQAKGRFVKEIAEKKIQHNIRHYRELDSRRIPSPALNNQFLKVFCAYSCAETNNRTAVTITQLKKLEEASNYFNEAKNAAYFYPHPVTKSA